MVSKKGVRPWTNINQANSKIQAKNFINNKYVKSALASDIQCDLVMDFVNGKKDGTGQYFYVNSPSATRHTGGGSSDIKATGQNKADFVCNIYDLEGNVRENSTGVGHQPRFPSWDWGYMRGGNLNYDSNWSGRASARVAFQMGLEAWECSFRMVLYVMK